MFGIHSDTHALTRRDRDRLRQAAAKSAGRAAMVRDVSAARLAQLEGEQITANPR
jgi:hypothetical protein